jgi:hypothetical protein
VTRASQGADSAPRQLDDAGAFIDLERYMALERELRLYRTLPRPA